ncbi:MAG: AAA family ATPase [Myxococcales bacterium]|nr:AAA family ATPase [Myxococcales bacterium]MCB9669721.1 AAA family ATPase [Alphaproteobacteria bacterium]
MSLRGRRVALTGSLPGTTRQEFKDLVAEAGGEYVSRLDASTDVLVTGDSPLPSKVESARGSGVDVVAWSTLRARLDGVVDEDVPLADGPVAGPPTVEVTDEHVRVLDLVLPRVAPGPLTPSREAFGDYVLDAPTLGLLRGIGRAVSLRQPCLIEGDTSTSKTSSVRYLASLVGAEVVRLNLNGQTDTGELVGRYVPDGAGWRFAEGLVPQAMRNGWWVVLDEVNLAEPAVLERLNPCLERVPELVLTEGPGTRFGPGGDVAVHPSFRVLATMNPAEYAGRSVLSEAWRDRFTSHLVARPAGELEYRQLVHHALTGEHPPLEQGAVRWSPAALAGTGDERLGADGLDELLYRLAPLFAGLDEMTRVVAGKAAPLGVERRERYVFSRRGLLGILDAVATLSRFDPLAGRVITAADDPPAAVGEAVRSALVDRMRGEEDRDRVRVLLESLGL